MGLFDKLKERFAPSAPANGQGYGAPQTYAPQGAGARRAGGAGAAKDPDEAAVERYRYMLRTAPPETIEQAHAEAFAKLTPEQRQKVLADLSAEVPPAERATADDPRSLARMATRAEMRQPGTMERALGGRGGMGGMGGGMGMGGMIAGSLLASVAGAFIGTAIADSFFDSDDSGEGDGGDGGEDMAGGEEFADDPGADAGGFDDFGGGDFGGGEF
jgi:Spy/CpxP family protein refolding chaperone